MSTSIFVGTSGWNYPHWSDGVFYPVGMKQSDWLGYYAQHFNSVEVNTTFYHLPARQVFAAWYTRTPSYFRFAVKANQFITHRKKLHNPEEYVARFLEQVSGLGEKLGVVLFQLPPNWKFHQERLEGLCGFLSQQKILPGLCSALEIRHTSWYDDACFAVLRKHNISLVLTDWPGCIVEGPLTANFVFVRRHGPNSLYASNYPDTYLQRDVQQIHSWLAEGRAVYIYFNNDAHGYAIKNALSLKAFLEEEKSLC